MKKILFMAVAAMGLLLGGCEALDNGFGDDGLGDNSSGDDGSDSETGVVRYEAVLADTENFDLQVLYATGEGATEHQIVESPFEFEFKAKTGELLYISASSVAKSGKTDEFSTVSVKIFENDKLMVSSTQIFYANVMGFFNVEGSYSDDTDNTDE